MIGGVTVSKNINTSEAAFINGVTSVCSPQRVSWYKKNGIFTPHLGTGGTAKGYDRTSSLIVSIKPSAFYDKRTGIDTKRLINRLDNIKGLTGLQKLPWLLSSVHFHQQIKTVNSKDYISLLYLGHSMKSISMKRTVDDPRSPSVLEYTSTGASLKIYALKYDVILDLVVRKERLKEYMKSRKIDGIDFKKLEVEMWKYYLGKLSGSGDYMTFSYAEEQISKLNCTRKIKDRYITLLKSVMYYKGLDKFLTKVKKPDPNSIEVSVFGNMATVNRDIRALEKAGINPVTISRRAASGHDTLPNIVSLLKY